MSLYNLIILASLLFSILSTSMDCVISDFDKMECGYMGITENQCVEKGCCWASSSVSGIPWCFFSAESSQSLSCPFFDEAITDPGFTSSEFEKMRQYFLKNLNIEGKGGVVAAFDKEYKDGEYFFHWARDGALTMKAYMEIHKNDYNTVHQIMDNYISWVLDHENNPSDNQSNNRVEPKFHLPDGNPFAGEWCRPQTDAPGLRTITYCQYANILFENGKNDEVNSKIWPLIKHDLEWLVSNWGQNTCDLWEEVRCDDFFFNRYTMRRGLLEAKKIAKKLGFSSEENKYKETAKSIEKTINNHWNQEYFTEGCNRPIDSSVITALVEGYSNDDYLPLIDEKVVKTINVLNKVFCREYSINSIDSSNGIPGVLHGRYPGDVYWGGNPWHLTTANVARAYYMASEYLLINLNKTEEYDLDANLYKLWYDSLKIKSQSFEDKNDKLLNLSSALISAGDAVLRRIYEHIKGDDFHCNEQINRNNGAQTSVKDLTWSYGNILTALKVREDVDNLYNGLISFFKNKKKLKNLRNSY